MTTNHHHCDCSPGHPGVLWPWGSDGAYPPLLPYVERCDSCMRYATDDDAADALVARLLTVGFEPVVGEQVCRSVIPTAQWHRLGRPEQRVGVFVYPLPAALHRDWARYVTTAKRSLAQLNDDTIVRDRRHREVFVVRPGDPSADVAVFEREQDADAFAATFDDVGDVERATVCGHALASQLIADRHADEDAIDAARQNATCAGCLARTYRGESCVCDPRR